MPKLRESPEKLSDKRLISAITGGCVFIGIKPVDLALPMMVTKSTFYRRMKDPETFTLKELRAVSKKLRIPISEMLGEK